eukprot:c5170_g1_i1.p1 GENE.c5170_g1_i1~~c5170_g1_i1.p1  ORF type:complete len:209 (-),score=59.02 c5170_g1_i1:5-631(-)
MSAVPLLMGMLVSGWIGKECAKQGFDVLFSYHPLCMCIGVLVFGVLANSAAIARKLPKAKEGPAVYMESHANYNSLLALFVVIGFTAIFINKILNNKNHFVTLHAQIGLVAVLLMTCNFLFGWFSAYQRSTNKIVYARVDSPHKWSGRIATVLLTLAIAVGMFSNWAEKRFTLLECYAVCGVVVLVQVGVFSPLVLRAKPANYATKLS